MRQGREGIRAFGPLRWRGTISEAALHHIGVGNGRLSRLQIYGHAPILGGEFVKTLSCLALFAHELQRKLARDLSRHQELNAFQPDAGEGEKGAGDCRGSAEGADFVSRARARDPLEGEYERITLVPAAERRAAVLIGRGVEPVTFSSDGLNSS